MSMEILAVDNITRGMWISAAFTVVGAFVLGWLVAKLASAQLHRAASLTSIKLDDVLVSAVTPVIEWWFVAGGLFVAKLQLQSELEPRYEKVISGVLLFVLIGSVTNALARFGADSVRLYSLRTSGVRSSSSLFVNLTKISVYALGLLVLLQSLGVSVAPLLAAFGVGGLAVALALQPTLSNLFSGIQLLASGQIRPGDYVEVDQNAGYVEDINWRNTTLRKLGNNHIVIPNAVMSDSVITNYYLPVQEMSVSVVCGVSYNSDLDHVEEVCQDVARQTMAALPQGAPEFEPLIRFFEFGDSSINVKIILRVNEIVDRYQLTHDFVKALHARFAKEGIEIPFPQRVVHKASPAD